MALPNAHCLLHGVLRDFLELIFSAKALKNRDFRPSKISIRLMRTRIREVTLTHDFKRPVRDPTKVWCWTLMHCIYLLGS